MGTLGQGHNSGIGRRRIGPADLTAISLLAYWTAMDFEDESTWLRHRVLRLRTILRFVKDARAESGLRELIGEAEQRLDQLEARARTEGPCDQ
jgi:hypothetical protein